MGHGLSRPCGQEIVLQFLECQESSHVETDIDHFNRIGTIMSADIFKI